jgi:hypothetical protein
MISQISLAPRHHILSQKKTMCCQLRRTQTQVGTVGRASEVGKAQARTAAGHLRNHS